MAMIFRHTCRRCRKPVRNKAALDWEHLDGSTGHRIQVVATKVADDREAVAA